MQRCVEILMNHWSLEDKNHHVEIDFVLNNLNQASPEDDDGLDVPIVHEELDWANLYGPHSSAKAEAAAAAAAAAIPTRKQTVAEAFGIGEAATVVSRNITRRSTTSSKNCGG